MTWFLKQRAISRLYGTDFTEECERWFPAANRTEKDIENLLVDDLVVMQSEFRKDYRRFVIITDTRSTSNASKEAATASTSNYTARDMVSKSLLVHHVCHGLLSMDGNPV